MKAVVYSTQPFEKELLAKANNKKHDITLISNSLTPDTAFYAEGKDAVVVSTTDTLDKDLINKLADFGIRYICTRSVSTDHIDRVAAANRTVKVANVPHLSQASNPDQEIAAQTIKNLDNWHLNKCTGKACACLNQCRKDEIISEKSAQKNL